MAAGLFEELDTWVSGGANPNSDRRRPDLSSSSIPPERPARRAERDVSR